VGSAINTLTKRKDAALVVLFREACARPRAKFLSRKYYCHHFVKHDDQARRVPRIQDDLTCCMPSRLTMRAVRSRERAEQDVCAHVHAERITESKHVFGSKLDRRRADATISDKPDCTPPLQRGRSASAAVLIFANLLSRPHTGKAICLARSDMVETSKRLGRRLVRVDLGANFRIDKHTIVDIGLNLGLNRAAPQAQVYSGIPFRF
jgi:hypothetical protein